MVVCVAGRQRWRLGDGRKRRSNASKMRLTRKWRYENLFDFNHYSSDLVFVPKVNNTIGTRALNKSIHTSVGHFVSFTDVAMDKSHDEFVNLDTVVDNMSCPDCVDGAALYYK